MSHESLDFRDLTRAALERMLKNALLKKGDHADAKKKAAQDDEDKERDDLADLHETNTKSNAPKVEEDDFDPADLAAARDSDDDSDDGDDKKKSSGKAPPFTKSKGKDDGKGNPFKKKKKKGGFPPKKGVNPFAKKGE